VTNTGVVTTVAGLPGSPGNVNGSGKRARFSFPEGIGFLPDGRLLIADSYNHAIRIGDDGPTRRRNVRH